MQFNKICTPSQRDLIFDPIPGKLKTKVNQTFCTPPGAIVPVLRRFVFPEDTRDQLFELLKWCEKNEKEQLPTLPFITIMHYNFVRIHPFTDTNGRCCRLLTSLFMLRRNFPAMIIDPKNRNEYMSALAYVAPNFIFVSTQ